MLSEELVKTIVAKLRAIKEKYGEDAYQEGIEDFAQQYIGSETGEAILLQVFPDFDLEAFKAGGAGRRKAVSPPMPDFGQSTQEEQMLQMLGQQIPNMKTQAQLTVFMAAFDGLRMTLNEYFGGNYVQAEAARNALNTALDLGRQVAGISEKLEDVSNATKSDTAVMFETQVPIVEAVLEQDIKQLLGELDSVDGQEALAVWYEKHKQSLESITDQKLRNKVYDKIRTKKREFGKN